MDLKHKTRKMPERRRTMGMSKLSHVLLDFGFFSALGTSERGLPPEEALVKRGTPNTFDSNNGVTVVYDEEGRPWIMHHTCVTDEVWNALQEYSLKCGANVPHSNDGGHFMHEVVLTL
jgi:hypothetical protein